MPYTDNFRIPLTLVEARDALDSLRVDNVLHGSLWGVSLPAGRLLLTSDPVDRPYLPFLVGRRVDGVVEIGRRQVPVEIEVLPFSNRDSELVLRMSDESPRSTRFLLANARTVRSLAEALVCSLVGAAADLVEVRRDLVTTSA